MKNLAEKVEKQQTNKMIKNYQSSCAWKRVYWIVSRKQVLKTSKMVSTEGMRWADWGQMDQDLQRLESRENSNGLRENSPSEWRNLIFAYKGLGANLNQIREAWDSLRSKKTSWLTKDFTGHGFIWILAESRIFEFAKS